MGTVKIDLNKDIVTHQDLSLNSIEDIYDFIYRLDIVYNEYKDGSQEALILYNEFRDLIKNIKDNTYIAHYHDAILGLRPLSKDDWDKDINEVCASRIGVTVEEFKEGLHKNICDIHKLKQERWLSQFKNKLIELNCSKKHDQLKHFNEKRLLEIDFIKKYVNPRLVYRKEKKPNSLEELYVFQKYIEEKIKELKKKVNKYKKKDNKRYEKYKNELKKYNTINIQVRKDINIIREYYGETLGNQNKQPKREFVSYNGNIDEIFEAHENQLQELKNQSYKEIYNEMYVGKIKEIAKKVLTNRQYLIFEMYYFNGMTQQEIADIMGIPRQNVTREIDFILKKIKENI
jgi:RNA polymerase sigma factor (sigma-70 family)